VVDAPIIKNQKQVRIKHAFSGIQFEGDIDVNIKRASKGSSLTLQGDSRDLVFIKTSIKDGKVLVDIPDHYLRHGPVTATIYSDKLKHFAFNGNGNINAKNIRTSALNLELYINGKVNLSGQLHIRDMKVTGKNVIKLKGVKSKDLDIVMNGQSDITMSGVASLKSLRCGGKGKLSLYWVNSPHLSVESHDNVKVYIAGVARYLSAVTNDKSELDARYLRTNKVYVKAFGNSILRVVSNKELNAFAAGSGHIYYYNSPDLRAEHMVQNGAILNFVQYR